MIRINLLPHREEKRKQRKNNFIAICLLALAVGAAIGYAGHMYILGMIEKQDARNELIKKEIAALDTQIEEIKTLREQIDALLARKNVIESLQNDRSMAVHLFNDLIQRLPEGIYLRNIKQTGKLVNLLGYAQSNSRVSHLMRSLDESEYVENPVIIEVKSAEVNKRRLSDFSLNISVTQPKPGESTSEEKP